MRWPELIRRLGIKYRQTGSKHCRPGWIQFLCPYCKKGPDKWHLGLNTNHGYFHCWSCGSHPLLETLSKLTGRPIKEIYPLISDVRKDPVKTKKVQRGQLVIPKRVRPLQEPHKRYLRARNFSPAEIEEVWSVKGIGIDTQLAWRLWIPIIQNRETVSWTTRTIDPDNEMRYISASPKEEAVPHKEVLYGEDYCRSAIIITEGPTDVWRIGKGAVATFGLGFEPAQVKRMLQYPVRVVCFDNSKEAQKRAKKLAGTLSLYKGETYVVNLSADDAGSASPEEIKELRSRFL